MTRNKESQEILRELLASIYQSQARTGEVQRDSYLRAHDGQYLGRMTSNVYDPNSILNVYGPYGSPYSSTSIFNPYSPYGSEYGQYSVNNPFSTTPPELIINGRSVGKVSKNQFVSGRIPTESFLYNLKHNIGSVLSGQIHQSEGDARQLRNESFILASDGTFLGRLNPNQYDSESIFNRFGPYGSKYSQTSVFNPYSTYGSRLSHLSPFNPHSADPPKLFVHGKFHAYLTVNPVKFPRVDPTDLNEWAQSNVGRY